MRDRLYRFIFGTLGLGLFLGSGYGIYYILVELIIKGIFKESWLSVVAGGILAYLFVGLLGIGAIIGGYLFLSQLLD